MYRSLAEGASAFPPYDLAGFRAGCRKLERIMKATLELGLIERAQDDMVFVSFAEIDIRLPLALALAA
jgi:hypothetical protein